MTAGIHVQKQKSPSLHATFHAPQCFFTSFPNLPERVLNSPENLLASGFQYAGC